MDDLLIKVDNDRIQIMVTMVNKKVDFALKSLVIATVSSVLSDPDYGLEVKASFAKKLSSVKRNAGKGISLAQAKKKYW